MSRSRLVTLRRCLGYFNFICTPSELIGMAYHVVCTSSYPLLRFAIERRPFRNLDDLISIVSYTPPVPHAQPTLLQALLTLPPNGTMHLTMDVTKPFLRYTEHPPDAQRGWDLPPAVFIPLVPDTQLDKVAPVNGTARSQTQGRFHRIYTPILLVDLATPDFSMPYNVIIMSCTLIALIFGSVFNLLTRKFVVVSLPIEDVPTPARAM